MSSGSFHQVIFILTKLLRKERFTDVVDFLLAKRTRPDTRHKVLQNTFFHRQREGVMDLRTDGRTDPLIEALRST